MDRVCIYLRKSRADLDAEARGEGETLAKHKKALLQHAKLNKLNIVQIREEIVSGESLLHRPEMQELLREVESKKYNAVLVMDVDRLGRGNMQEQGLILETFRSSNTKIITPRKVYDLNDEFDEEYSEFEAFMARKELKIITRRLQGGRVRSVEEGNYIGTRPPYGYQIEKKDNERYLIPHPEQAPVVKMIFEMYTKDNLGSNKIANELNLKGYKTYTNVQWRGYAVLNVLKNAVYAGRIQWKKKEQKKSNEVGKRRDTRTRPVEEWIDVEGKHEPLISMETYQRAQEILKTKYHVPYQLENGITNPLAGLIKCDMCGSSMILRPYTNQLPHLMCYNRFCKNKSSRFAYVETGLLNALEEWLESLKIELGNNPDNSHSNDKIKFIETSLQNMQRELIEIEKQKEKLHDLLERGIYDEETFINRSRNLSERYETIQSSIVNSEQDLKNELKRNKNQLEIIPSVEQALWSYKDTEDPKKKNATIKSILDYAIYRKEKTQRNDDFDLKIKPRINPHR
ncbi:recombinase family protein [Chengkuizengella sp. SCS-71B]|uniref:recombinase family protein n=1 Tax=Chengkuizengella sp. SCS-71B TaxID=3115290 RepID=UPI0032C24694